MSKHRKNANEARVKIGRGLLGGRYITFHPDHGIRPTLDRVREAVFSMLTPYQQSHGFVDLFAGSGAFGIEAAGIGYDPVWMLDTHPGITMDLVENARTFQITPAIYNRSALHFPSMKPPEGDWILFADPPFDMPHLHGEMLTSLEREWHSRHELLYVMEHQGSCELALNRFETLKDKRYGRIHITIFRLPPSLSD